MAVLDQARRSAGLDDELRAFIDSQLM